jgi:hypothetical protein
MRPAMKLVLLAGKRHTNVLRFTVSHTSGFTITPQITRGAGCPYTATWDWGDGSALETGDSMSHAYAAAGTYNVTLRLPRADRWLVTIDMNGDRVVGDALAALRGCRALTYIALNLNAGLNSAYSLATLRRWWPTMATLNLSNTQSLITGTLADLPASMERLYLSNTQSLVTGTLADLPASMTTLYLYNTQSAITGTLADLPASITILRLDSTQSVITGTLADLPASMRHLQLNNTQSLITGGGAATSRALATVRLENLGLDQPAVDSILYSLYLATITPRTASGGTINLGGTNAAPSGTYQAATSCPVTEDTDGAEIAWELLNDGCDVGFNKWSTVTITAPEE